MRNKINRRMKNTCKIEEIYGETLRTYIFRVPSEEEKNGYNLRINSARNTTCPVINN